jgi:beta-lactamase regulating signal transducer with metallopeptidase domain
MDTTSVLLLGAAWGLRAAHWVGAWLLTYAMHSTVLLLAAWGIVSRSRGRWSPSAQHGIWRVALVAGWITSAAQVASPWRPLLGDVRLPAGARPAIARVQLTSHDAAAMVPSVAEASADPFGVRPVDPFGVRLMVVAVPRTALAIIAWSLVAGAMLGHLALARRRLLAGLGPRRDAGGTMAGAALRHLAELGGVTRPLALSTSDALRAPAAISQDEIVLPTRALQELTLAQQEGVLAHELAHVVRGDPRWLRIATWIERIAWFQPLNRVARRAMQQSAEFAADDWAVSLTRAPLPLAQALARVTEWLSPASPSPGSPSPAGHLPGADGSPLVQRVRRLTAPSRPADGRGGRLAVAAMGLMAVAALALLPRYAPAVDRSTTTTLELVERVEWRAWTGDGRDSVQGGARATPPPLRVVRLRDGGVRLERLTLGDSAAMPRAGRRALFLTTRTTS